MQHAETLTLEVGEEDPPKSCPCCGRDTRSVHGFVYRDDDAYAIYYAAWSEGHVDRGVTVALATGEWGDDSTASDRVSVGMEAKLNGAEIHLRFIEPETSPWADTPLLGKMISRDDALRRSGVDQTLKLAEYVLENDARIAEFLCKK